ncbi:hypothetical protein OC834_000180 [Tilletia horrida]|uniref:ATP synthase subunit epsilon, mitochondrial n=1 Tax=Tilletia horrida TaxID=155126 RepID=A0AAN6JMN3_9BASI|nr:hypothetical protein OC842_001321 [Tilletia horrida]KAK0539177.1 hypothetical protein OC834_000180 [Tilletia horrida]
MSSAAWRAHFTFNKYASISARAVRNVLKEEEKVKAARRDAMALRFQEWKDGKATDSAPVENFLKK